MPFPLIVFSGKMVLLKIVQCTELGDSVTRVLVIPDIQLKMWIFDRAETILKAGKADRVVCLMNIPDDVIVAVIMHSTIISGVLQLRYGTDHSMSPKRYSEQIYTNRW